MADTLTEAQRDQIQAEVFAGRKIQAIKAYRAATGADLKTATAAVESLEADLRASDPDKFAAEASKGGCMGIVLLLLVLLMLAVPAIAATWAWSAAR